MTDFQEPADAKNDLGMVQCKHCSHHRIVGDMPGKRCTKETYFPRLSGERWRRCHLFTENPATAHLRRKL